MSTNVLAFSHPQMSTQLADPQAQTCLDLDKLGVARKRLRVVQSAEELMTNMNWSVNRAAEHIFAATASATHPLSAVCLSLGKKDKRVSKAQIARWVKAYQKNGLTGLVDQRAGRQKTSEGWELRAVALFAKPQQPSFQLVVDQLLEEGFKVTYHRVRRYLNSLPTDMTTHSNGRLGAHYNRLNNRSYKIREFDNIPVGFIYQGDGHCCDVYVAHPTGNKVYRPELSAWIDVRSRMIVGWWLGDAENARDTLFSLSHAMVGYNHVPAMLHVDHGSGYQAKMLSDESTGFYARFNIEVMSSIPGNAKGKGQIERWFRTMEEKFGKRWDTYCGKDMSGDEKRRIVQAVNRGEYQLPSLAHYTEELGAWIHKYNNTAHRALGGKTPAEVWSTLEQVALEIPSEAVVLPMVDRTVRRTGIQLDNRLYRSSELLHWEGKTVHVQYSLHSDKMVRILTPEGQWICDCELAATTKYLPESRIQEAAAKRLAGQRKRKQLHADEDERRARMLLGVESDLSLINDAQVPALESDDDGLILDVTADLELSDDDDFQL